MEVRGLTPVDSLYEYAGFRLATSLSDLALSVGLPLIFALAGLAYVVHGSLQRESMRDALIHVFYLMFMAWMIGPTQVEVRGGDGDLRGQLGLEQREDGKIQVPRFVAYLNGGADHVQRKAIESIDKDFLHGPFERERLAAALEVADVFDGQLKNDLWQFSLNCFVLAVARDPRPSAVLIRLDPLAPGAFDYGAGSVVLSQRGREGHFTYVARCEDARGELEARVVEHLSRNPFHIEVLNLLVQFYTMGQVKLEKPPDAYYRSRVLLRAMVGPRTPNGANDLVLRSLPKDTPGTRRELLPRDNHGFGNLLDQGYDYVVDRSSKWKQNFESDATMKQKTYIAITQGPYLYGLALMIVIGLFPVVGLVALLPGRWRALLNYAKVLVSIKLWPVCWAALSRFQDRSQSIDVFGDNVGTADFVIVLSSMYLLTPLFCFAMVALATSVSALPFQQGFSAPAGSAMGAIAGAARTLASKRV